MKVFYPKKSIPIVISVILTVIFICIVYFQLNETQLNWFINSDTLYLPSFFRDLIYDRSKNIEWFLPKATCFFPDMLLFFVVHFFTANFIKAMFLSGILMNLLLISAFYLLIRESIKNISPFYLCIGINLLLIFHLASLFAQDYEFTFYLTITNYHLGAYIISLFSLYYVIRYLKTNRTFNLVVFTLLYSLAVFSDFLIIFNLTIPLLFITFIFTKKGYRTQAFYLLFSNIIGFILGFCLYRMLLFSKSIHISDVTNLMFNFSKIPESYSIMFQQQFAYLKSNDIRIIIIPLCIISFLSSLIILINKLVAFFKVGTVEKSELLEIIYLIFIVVQTVVIYNGPALNGSYIDKSILRYNVYAFFINILNFGYLFHRLSLINYFSKTVYIFSVLTIICFSIVGIIEISKIKLKEGAVKLFSYYPDDVKNIDDLCIKHNLKYGLADYWTARKATMLSRHNVRIYQTYSSLSPQLHVVNRNWYCGSKDGKTISPAFQFVIPDNMNDSIVFKKLLNHILDTLKEGSITMIQTDPFTLSRESLKPVFINK
jgi:hypothetical protein